MNIGGRGFAARDFATDLLESLYAVIFLVPRIPVQFSSRANLIGQAISRKQGLVSLTVADARSRFLHQRQSPCKGNAMLRCAVPCCAVLCRAALCYAMIYYAILRLSSHCKARQDNHPVAPSLVLSYAKHHIPLISQKYNPGSMNAI